MKPMFETEAALCDAFLTAVPKGWTSYPETANFDILLVHDTGFQIGIEAKLKLNAKVILQASEGGYRRLSGIGPDARAVLVPERTRGGVFGEMARIAGRLSVTVLTLEQTTYGKRKGKWSMQPSLPRLEPMLTKGGKLDPVRWLSDPAWFDEAPLDRCTLPEYVPEVRAGVPAPQVLGHWKIQAMKLCVWVQRKKYLTRAHFKALKINPSRWMDGHWLQKAETRGVWTAGPHFPAESFKRQHPSVYDQVEADFDKWSEEAGLEVPPTQEPLL